MTVNKTGPAAPQTFEKQLKMALKWFHEPRRLGLESPLAAPYFLGAAVSVQNSDDDPLIWGQALQEAIQQAAGMLWGTARPANRMEIEQAMPELLQNPGSRRYCYLVLELRYFRRYFKPRTLAEIWDRFLGESRAEFYRDLDEAVAQLGNILLEQLQPTLRLEQPMLTGQLIGREELLDHCLADLQAGLAVTLSGPGGVGKTTLGAAIAAGWPAESVFWYTIRPALNDQLRSLLFSLGYFLHQQGASGLWQKLVADGGKVEDENLALGLMRHDLASLENRRPLLCFDEIDRLRPADADAPLMIHLQLLELLDSLRGLAPLLTIGQRVTLDSDSHYTLPGLTLSQTALLLRQAGISANKWVIEKLHTYTGGNPRLLQFCIAIHQEGAEVSEIVAGLPQSSALQPLFNRLWLRATSGERRLLQSLSVFRSPAPEDAWQTEQADLTNLVEWGLAQQDGRGGLLLSPALRDLIYTNLPGELREKLHLAAANIRASRGEYTAAAYHYWQGGRDQEAVRVWFPYQKQEMARGQADAALLIFQQISLRRLAKRERRALTLLRAELRQLTGEMREGLADLRAVDWPPEQEVTIRASSLEGIFLNALGYPDAALDSFDTGISVVARLLNQLVKLHNFRSRIYLRQRKMDQAWREARLAQYEAENLQGVVQAEQGQYADAYLSYQRALALAKSLDYKPGIARTHLDLVTLLSRQGKLAEVVSHAEEAITYFEQVGDRLKRAITISNLAAVYVQAKQFDRALETALDALPFFDQMNDRYFMAVTTANLAEAYFGLGDLSKAQRYAHYVLQQEEPFTQPYGLYTLGMVQYTEGDLAGALQTLAALSEIAGPGDDAYIMAYAQQALGKVYVDLQQVDKARQALQEAARLFDILGMAEEKATTAGLLQELVYQTSKEK